MNASEPGNSPATNPDRADPLARRWTIERVRAVDADLAAALNDLFDEENPWHEPEGSRFLADPGCLLLLARWEGAPCGFATANRLQRTDARRAEVLLYEIEVAEPYRRQGIATALISAAREWAHEVGADEVWVLAEADDPPAIATYRSMGRATEEQQAGESAVMFTFPAVEVNRRRSST